MDFVICDMFLTFIRFKAIKYKISIRTLPIKQSIDRTQVMDGTLTFDIDYMVFVAPNPQQADKFFALVYPLDTTVWLFILISFVLATIAFVTLSKTEEMVT